MADNRTSVRREDDYTYSNKYLDKEVRFEPAGDEVVATYDPEAASDAAETLGGIDTTAVTVVNAERGFAILRLGPDETTGGLADTLETSDPVRNVLPVMVDEEEGRRYFMPDELTVQFVEGIDDDEAQAIIADHGSRVVVPQRTAGYYTICVPDGRGLFETLQEFSSLDTVEFAEPSEIGVDDLLTDVQDSLLDITDDGYLEVIDLRAEPPDGGEDAGGADVAAIPSDDRFGELWGLHNTGQVVAGTSGTRDADIDAPQAWDITRGERHAIVSVIDTGADLDHPDLAPNLVPRGSEDWDFADSGDDVPWDSGDHGTHVAGTAVGASNAQGVVGVAPRARLMPLRVNLTSGMNQNRADAINYVADRAAADPANRYVVNCSWKMSGDHAGVRRAIRRANDRNVVVVFAAGNSNRDIDVVPQYPAVYPEVIAVAATDQADRRAGFSNFGGKVDVAAPGVNILSSVPDDTFGFKDGTSMASPHVAGLAALIWSRNKALTNDEVRNIIETTTDDISALNPGFVGQLGSGRINAYRALRATPPPRLEAQLVRQFAFPQRNQGSSTGLAFASRFRFGWWWGSRPALLFLTQQAGSERVFFLDTISGSVRYRIDPAGNDTIGSLAWDGYAILAANVTTGAGSINRINPYTGAQISSVPAPPGRGEGLAYDRRWLFYSTISTTHILRSTTGAPVRSFPSVGGPSRSLTHGRGWLFSGDTTTGQITVFNPWTMFVRGIIQAPGSGSNRAEGIAFDPRRRELYVANQSENTIYVLRVAIS